MPRPALTTSAPCGMRAKPPGSPPAEPLADWGTLVSEWLPVADALPVEIVARPSEVLCDLPLLDASPADALAVWRRPALFSDSLPVAVLPPVLARATPALATSAPCWMIRMFPSEPLAWPFADWLIVVLDWLPIADALPVEISAVPLLAFAAVPVFVAGPSADSAV